VRKDKIFIINKNQIDYLMKPYLLQAGELKELVVKIPGWEIKPEKIKREFHFANFIEAFSFMTKVALICEKYNHHPNWENVYSKVIIRLNTHDLGGITNLDQTLASEINKIFDQ
tara:strand:- start:131 stop:472 length:342 start_codon:yes stop_codon:yes gene_type:complete